MRDNVASLHDELAQTINGLRSKTKSSETAISRNVKRFKVALSFPGEYRDMVQLIARGLADIFTEECVLYDMFHRAEFARPNLDIHLQKLYHNASELIVVFVCGDYNRKKWCGIEWRAIRELLNSKKVDDRIMFVKCGEGAVDGVFGTIDGYINSSEVTIANIINDIVKRHSSLVDMEN